MFHDDLWRRLELGGGQVFGQRPSSHHPLRLQIPPTAQGYADAQIDDYGLDTISRRRDYPWQPGNSLQIRARFSHGQAALRGTAGFGFWNAPFGDPTVRWPALPQAAWFFFGSPPNNLPLSPEGVDGRGWYAATLDATTWAAKSMIPLAPFLLIGNQFARFRKKIWPKVQARCGISFALITDDMREWHTYRLHWSATGCAFWVDGRLLLQTSHSPQGPLGFVCWIDNQYMVVTPRGKFAWGTLPTTEVQWLEVSMLEIGEQVDRSVEK